MFGTKFDGLHKSRNQMSMNMLQTIYIRVHTSVIELVFTTFKSCRMFSLKKQPISMSRKMNICLVRESSKKCLKLNSTKFDGWNTKCFICFFVQYVLELVYNSNDAPGLP